MLQLVVEPIAVCRCRAFLFPDSMVYHRSAANKLVGTSTHLYLLCRTEQPSLHAQPFQK